MAGRQSSATVTRLIVVRHGETEGNVSRVWHGAMDAPLTARGMAQAEATAAYLAQLHRVHPIDHLFVSPLPRTQSTAHKIAAAIGLPPVIMDGLREFSIGDWEGRAFQDLRETEDLWGKWSFDPEFTPPNGESILSFGRRVSAVFQALVTRYPNQTLLAVTHGGVIASLLASSIGQSPADWRRFDPDNCAVSILEWDGAQWTSLQINSIEHLPMAARAERIEDY